MAYKDRINYKGIDIDFEYTYSPEERQTYDYPGCSEEWEIYNLKINGQDADELLESQFDEFFDFVVYTMNELKNEY
jgi:hypothetical protein